MSDAPRRISVVVPVLDEGENVDRCHAAVDRVFAALADRYTLELIFTDNHSADDSFDRVRSLVARDPRVRGVRFSRNFGYQRSILAGYARATGDAVVQLDCDLQDPPELIPELLARWVAGAHVVYGVRRARPDEGLVLRTARRAFSRLIDLLSEDRLPHDAGDFRLLDRRVLDALLAIDDQQPYLRGAIAGLGFTQEGMPYDRHPRTSGRTKFPLRALAGLAVDGILNHSTVPLRLATWTGILVSGITFLAMCVYALARMGGAQWPAGWATTTVLQLLTLSLICLFLGIIGEYLGRIYRQVKRRPLTIVESEVGGAPGAEPE